MKLLLIDGTNLFIRSLSVNKIKNSYGTYIGGVVGMLKTIYYLKKEFRPDKILVVFDGENTYQKKLLINKNYKSNRNNNYYIRAFKWNMMRILDYFDKLNISYYITKENEADDVIGLIIKYIYLILNEINNEKIIIVSSDKDYLQLINEKTVVYNPVKKEIIDLEKFKREYKIYPFNYPIFKAIVGDKSDNIKGVENFGIKKFEKYFSDFF